MNGIYDILVLYKLFDFTRTFRDRAMIVCRVSFRANFLSITT